MKPDAQNPTPPDPRIASRLQWAVEACARTQLRLTTARRRLLTALARESLPATLEALAGAPELAGHCDATTVYRTLMLFSAAGLVRQVNLRHKVRHFVLNEPGGGCDYLICQSCGAITQLPPLKSLLHLEQRICAIEGYSGLHHELELYGICPACRPAWDGVSPPNKLPIRP